MTVSRQTLWILASLLLVGCGDVQDDIREAVDCFRPVGDPRVDFGLVPPDAPQGAIAHTFQIENTCPTARAMPEMTFFPPTSVRRVWTSTFAGDRVPSGSVLDIVAFVTLATEERLDVQVRLPQHVAPIARVSAQLDPNARLVRRALPSKIDILPGCAVELDLELAYDGAAPLDFDAPTYQPDSSPDWEESWDPPPPWSLGVHAPETHRLHLRLHPDWTSTKRTFNAALPTSSFAASQLALTVDAAPANEPGFTLRWPTFARRGVEPIPLGLLPEPESLAVFDGAESLPFTYDADTNTMLVEGAGERSVLYVTGEPLCLP